MLVIRLPGEARELLEVALSGELLRGFNVEMLQPPPLKASTAGEDVKLWLAQRQLWPNVLYLTLRSDGVGRFDSQVAISTSVDFSQFIYPQGISWTWYCAQPPFTSC